MTHDAPPPHIDPPAHHDPPTHNLTPDAPPLYDIATDAAQQAINNNLLTYHTFNNTSSRQGATQSNDDCKAVLNAIVALGFMVLVYTIWNGYREDQRGPPWPPV